MAGHVYVNDTTAGTNTIGPSTGHAGETLTPAAGSCCPVARARRARWSEEQSSRGTYVPSMITSSPCVGTKRQDRVKVYGADGLLANQIPRTAPMGEVTSDERSDSLAIGHRGRLGTLPVRLRRPSHSK